MIFTNSDGDIATLAVMSDRVLQLYQVQYYNQIILNEHDHIRERLIERCKGIKLKRDLNITDPVPG